MSNDNDTDNPPGWYQDPDDQAQGRYWTGSEWVPRVQVVDPEPMGWPPANFLFVGALLLVIATALFAYNSDSDSGQVAGLVLSLPGWVLLGIGIVAKGVQVGRRHP